MSVGFEFYNLKAGQTPTKVQSSAELVKELSGAGASCNIHRLQIPSRFQTTDHNDPGVLVHLSRLLHRLRLERRLLWVTVKILNFIVYFLCFSNALSTFWPSHEISIVHERLHHMFDTIEPIRTHPSGGYPLGNIEDFYSYVGSVDQQMRMLMPTRDDLWCPDMTYEWNDILKVPENTCQYRRPSHMPEADPAGPQSFRDPSSAAPPTSKFTKVPVKCLDDDEGLKILTEDRSMTCIGGGSTDIAGGICGRSETAALCRKTCGHCGPFEYSQMTKYTDSMLAIVPSMVWQTRYQPNEKGCSGFADTYNVKSDSYLQDGTPIDKHPIVCRRYNTDLDALDYSKRFPCVGTQCSVWHYKGSPTYAELLVMGDLDVERLKDEQWLDWMTFHAGVSALVYTKDLEVFTLVELDMEVDQAGTGVLRSKFSSYKDLSEAEGSTLLTHVTATLIFTAAGMFLAFVQMKDQPRAGPALQMELMSLGATLLFCLVLLVTWASLTPMSDQYSRLLNRYIAMSGVTGTERDQVLQEFLVAAERHQAMGTFIHGFKIVGILVLLLLIGHFVTLISEHPKVRVLAFSMIRILTELMNGAIVVASIFFISGVVAHLLFGEAFDDFASVSSSLTVQFKMLFGETFAMNDESKLRDGKKMLYWVYMALYMVTMAMGILYILLALQLQSYIFAKKHTRDFDPELDVSSSILQDFCDIFASFYTFRNSSWPSKDQIIRAFTNNSTCVEDDLMDMKQFTKIVSKLHIDNSEQVPEDMLRYYQRDWRCGNNLVIDVPKLVKGNMGRRSDTLTSVMGSVGSDDDADGVQRWKVIYKNGVNVRAEMSRSSEPLRFHACGEIVVGRPAKGDPGSAASWIKLCGESGYMMAVTAQGLPIMTPHNYWGKAAYWLCRVIVKRYGVLGQAEVTGRDNKLEFKRLGDEPPTGTAFVDPAGLDYIQKIGPCGAGGATGAICSFLQISGNSNFPKEVVAAVQKTGDAKLHDYNGKVCIHSAGPNFRQEASTLSEEEGIQMLAVAYKNVLMEFAASSCKALRLLPISGGIFMGNFDKEFPKMTAEALQRGFESLTNLERQRVQEASVEMCIFCEEEYQNFAKAFKELLVQTGRNLRMAAIFDMPPELDIEPPSAEAKQQDDLDWADGCFASLPDDTRRSMVRALSNLVQTGLDTALQAADVRWENEASRIACSVISDVGNHIPALRQARAGNQVVPFQTGMAGSSQQKIFSLSNVDGNVDKFMSGNGAAGRPAPAPVIQKQPSFDDDEVESV